MHVQPLRVDAIVVSKRMLPLRDKVVDQLVGSMREIGLVNPITIRWPNGGLAPQLVTGRCRLEAARQLGWETIACSPVEGDDDHAALMEIDENLARSTLTAAQRARHVRVRKEVYERLHPETRHGGAPGAGRGKAHKVAKLASFSADTSQKTGRSERSIRRDAARAERVPELDRVVDTSLDKGAELDALAALPPDAQHTLIDRAVAGERVTAKAALADAVDWVEEETWHLEHFCKCRAAMLVAWEAWVACEPEPPEVRDAMDETWQMMLQASGLEWAP
jgi:ParB-like chromosome segregation protein Spo0J